MLSSDSQNQQTSNTGTGELMKRYRQIISENPQEVGARVNLGTLLSNIHQYDEAIELFDKALILDPTNPDIYNNKGISLKDKNDLKASMQCFEKATQLDENYILGFANKAQVQQLLGLIPQALISLRQASNLLKDVKAVRKLNSGQLKYISKSVEIILNLHSNFLDQGVVLEQVELNAQLPIEQQNVLQEYNELKNQKDEIANKEFLKIQISQSTRSPLRRQSTRLIQEDVVEDLMEKLSQLTEQMVKLQDVNITLQKQVSDNSLQQEEMKQTLKISGVYDIAKIKEGWDNLQDTNPELYDYTKTFYWTLINCFEAYRIANTGAVQVNLNHTENKIQGTVVKITSTILDHGLKFAQNLPIVGRVIEAINSAIDAIYSKIKSKNYSDRINSINKIIMLNRDPYAQNEEDQSRMIAQAALEIASKKKEIIDGKISESLITHNSSPYQKAIDYINQEVEYIQTFAVGEKIELYSSVAAKEALKDVMLLLIYMSCNYESIIEATRNTRLYKIIADSVIQKKSAAIINELFQVDTEVKQLQQQQNISNNNQTQQAKSTQSSRKTKNKKKHKCNIM